MFSGAANQLAIANWLALAPSLHDDRCTLTDVGVDQTPVLETSRFGEGEAERRRELRVAWREEHAGVHVAGAVVLGGGGGCEGLRIEERLWRAAGLGLRHNELGWLLSAGKRHRVDLEGVAHRPRDSRTAWNNQGLLSEAEHRIALLAVPHEGHNEGRAVTFDAKVGEAC